MFMIWVQLLYLSESIDYIRNIGLAKDQTNRLFRLKINNLWLLGFALIQLFQDPNAVDSMLFSTLYIGLQIAILMFLELFWQGYLAQYQFSLIMTLGVFVQFIVTIWNLSQQIWAMARRNFNTENPYKRARIRERERFRG